MNWINVKDDLPKQSGQYLVYKNKSRPIVTIAAFGSHHSKHGIIHGKMFRFLNGTPDNNVTHWMDIPAPPGKLKSCP